jgi:hypothetical protein
MQAAPGQGIVSSFVMESDDLDEIDWEWIGSDSARAQSNYFGKGNTTTYDRGQFHDVSSPTSSFHTYAVNWTQETTTWLVDGKAVRTLNFADAVDGTNYPQTPMNVRLGSWVAGDPKNSPGTIQWAGGLADFTKGPFNMYVQSVKIVNYNPAESYEYGDQSGTWQSIKLLGSAASGSVSDNTNSTTGPGEIPFSGSSATGGLGPQTTFSIKTGSMGPTGIIGKQTTTCTDKSHHTGSSGYSGWLNWGSGSGKGQGQGHGESSKGHGSTYTISPGGSVHTPAPGGGIVGVATNNTSSVVTIKLGSSGAVAVATANPTATSFSLGTSATATGMSPAQVTTNAGRRNGGQPLGALAAFLGLAMFAL